MKAFDPSRTAFAWVTTTRIPAPRTMGWVRVFSLGTQHLEQPVLILPFPLSVDDLEALELVESMLSDEGFVRSSPWEPLDSGFRCWVEFDAGAQAEKLIQELSAAL